MLLKNLLHPQLYSFDTKTHLIVVDGTIFFSVVVNKLSSVPSSQVLASVIHLRIYGTAVQGNIQRRLDVTF